jgi:aryl-alcohol dehydrogenase-like predicted oxidoreductase
MTTATPAAIQPLTARVPYGGTGLLVSRLCWGTGLMADLRHHLPVPLASRILLRGFELGVNFWDTADGYKTHPHVADALRQLPRDQVVVNTKTRARTAPEAEADVERFLRELGTGHIDTLLMHNVETVEDLDARAPVLESLLRAKAAGKVRAVGLSTHLGSGAIMDACADRPQIEVVLTTVNREGLMLKNATLEQHLPLVQRVFEAGKAICLMKTLAQGRLARTPDEVREAIRFNLGLPYAHSVCVGVNAVSEVEFAVSAAAEAA